MTSNTGQAHRTNVITAEQARAQGVTPRSLMMVAEWNDNQRGPLAVRQRRANQADELRRVAAQLVATDYRRAA